MSKGESKPDYKFDLEIRQILAMRPPYFPQFSQSEAWRQIFSTTYPMISLEWCSWSLSIYRQGISLSLSTLLSWYLTSAECEQQPQQYTCTPSSAVMIHESGTNHYALIIVHVKETM